MLLRDGGGDDDKCLVPVAAKVRSHLHIVTVVQLRPFRHKLARQPRLSQVIARDVLAMQQEIPHQRTHPDAASTEEIY